MHSERTRKTTAKAHEQIHQEDAHHDQQDHESDVLPKHPPSQTLASHPKVSRRATEAIGLVNQEVDAFSSLQHSLDILRHDAPHIVHFPLHVPERIFLSGLGGTIVDHELLQRRVEGRRC